MKKYSSNSTEGKKKRIERNGFTLSRVVSPTHPEGLYVARIGNVAWYYGKSVSELQKKIFGY